MRLKAISHKNWFLASFVTGLPSDKILVNQYNKRPFSHMTDFIHPNELNIPHKDSWKMFRIISEFVSGFDTMSDLGPSVSIFGSSRLAPTSCYYDLAYQVAMKVAEQGFSVITGAGPSIMEAANKGAQATKTASCGLIIDLPFESEPNHFIDSEYALRFRYFFVRKVMFVRYAQGFVFLPGGYGTFDEMFEVLTLIQTKKIQPVPVFLMGKEYWGGLFEWLASKVVQEGCISDLDLSLFEMSDDPDYVAKALKSSYMGRTKLRDIVETT